MKYTLAPGFLPEFERLPPQHRALFLAAIKEINAAYAQRSDRAIPRWPANLRIKHMRGYPDLWEMTWSFSGPDGRAVFEFITIDGELAIR